MPFATVTKYEPEAWHYTKPVDLVHGDLVARVSDNGVVQPRVLLRPNGKGSPSALGFPKRMERDADAQFERYVNDDGQVLVIGHVTPAEAKPKASSTKGKATGKPKASQSKTDTQDTDTTSTSHEATTPASPSGKMTKASAADALDALAIAVQAVANALR